MAIHAAFVFNAPFDPMDRHLLPEEKLAILQTADSRRKWYSLDDQRVCVLCGRTITGRQIDVTRNSSGGYSLSCPTQGCASLPNDWFYRGNASSSPKNADHRSSEVTFWGENPSQPSRANG